jgi:hypothetical protein
MTLASNQEKTGFERTDSKNDTAFTGRPDGSEGAQKDLGYDLKDSPRSLGDMGPDNSQPGDSNFKLNQGKLGSETVDSRNSKSGNPSRTDKVKEIS